MAMKKVDIRFADLLAEKRTKDNKKWSYRQMSEATGISHNTLRDYMKGDLKRFDEVTIVKICDFLECDLKDLLIYQVSQQDIRPLAV